MEPRRRVERPSGAEWAIRGTALWYLALMVLLPIVAMGSTAFSGGVATFWKAISGKEAVSAMLLTFEMSVLAAAITVVAGVGIAWTLKRREFVGKRLLEALIDLPLATPAIVTGLIVISLYRPQGVIGSFLGSHGIEVLFAKPGILLALLFVTLPLMVRSVQPVMDELEPDVEQAAYTLGATRLATFRAVTLPTLMPAIATGASLTVARALGEFGSLVLIAGNIPYRTEVAPTYVYAQIESGKPEGAAAVAMALLLASVVMLLAIELAQSRAIRRQRGR